MKLETVSYNPGQTKRKINNISTIHPTTDLSPHLFEEDVKVMHITILESTLTSLVEGEYSNTTALILLFQFASFWTNLAILLKTHLLLDSPY